MQIACPRVTEPKGQESWAVYTSVLTSHFLRNFRSGLFRQISSLDYGQSPLCSLEDLKCGMGCDNQQEHRAVLTARGMSSATDRGHCTLVRAQCKQPNWFLKMILWRKKNAECKLTHGSRFFFFQLLEHFNQQNGSIQMNFKMKSMHPRGRSNMRVSTAHNEKPVRWKKARVQSTECGGMCKRGQALGPEYQDVLSWRLQLPDALRP